MFRFRQDLRLLWMVLIAICICVAGTAQNKEIRIADTKSAWPIVVENNAPINISTAARLFSEDIERLTGNKPQIIAALQGKARNIILAGTLQESALIKQLMANGKMKAGEAISRWEGYSIQWVDKPFNGIDRALVIASNHARGVSFGLMHLSQMFGVSPWYWWADVPVAKKNNISLPSNYSHEDYPGVKYRGIFINDEAPALSSWSKEKFGGFNAGFYSKVFELMLRLKANYIWPAMWGNAFYDDDSLNIHAAKEYGIVIGTSHHEPLMRAHDEWRRYGTGKWNYDSNEVNLKEFWQKGMRRATNEKIVTVGMRGDGDEPMSRETATSLLERIVTDQRKIIEEVTGKPAEQTPQLWALYKEVQDYYDKGMRVPDDVTLLLCDDNWGNIRRLPALNEKPRKGGYGIYYHFDYVGGPRNYKWINTNHISRIWEQMHLAWQYKAREIWIVNVGDIKPMEFPISFFLDYAWSPEKIKAEDLNTYTKQWAAKQFGSKNAETIAELIDGYTKINSRRKPELLDARTYSQNYNEWARVVKEYDLLEQKTNGLLTKIPVEQQSAFFQLVQHPVQASANLYRMYYAHAMNVQFAQKGDTLANGQAKIVKDLYDKDSLISIQYHTINGGKWNHMMSQTHIGYTYWQQPRFNKMPAVQVINTSAVQKMATNSTNPPAFRSAKDLLKGASGDGLFFEHNGMASIYASHFTRKNENDKAKWQILPGHGRTGDAITTFPVTHADFSAEKNSPWLEFDVLHYSQPDSIALHLYFSPTLNFMHLPKGLQFEVSVNGDAPQIISLNEKDYETRTWESWVASNIIIKKSVHAAGKKSIQSIRYRPLHPGIVLQKVVVDFGGLLPSYLGPEETNF